MHRDLHVSKPPVSFLQSRDPSASLRSAFAARVLLNIEGGFPGTITAAGGALLHHCRDRAAIRTAALDVDVGPIAPSLTSAAIENDANARNGEPRLADRLEEGR
jgi:hypothetical protein